MIVRWPTIPPQIPLPSLDVQELWLIPKLPRGRWRASRLWRSCVEIL